MQETETTSFQNRKLKTSCNETCCVLQIKQFQHGIRKREKRKILLTISKLSDFEYSFSRWLHACTHKEGTYTHRHARFKSISFKNPRCPATVQNLMAAAVKEATTAEQNYGKVNITGNYSDGFYCENVLFPSPFQNGGTIKVFPSLSHEDHPGNGNEAAVAVVTSIDQNSFSICLLEPAQPTGEMTLNWFAFNDGILPRGIQTGSVLYSVFTSGSACNDISFARTFYTTPKILLSVRHSGSTERNDVMSFWAEDVTEIHFRVCLREMVSFSGTHDNLYLDWPSLQDNYAYCKIQNFTRRFHEPPAVLVSAHRAQSLSALTDQNIVTWVKDVGVTAFEICIKDLPGINGQHEPITVDYAAVGDLDPCLDVVCEKFAVCRAFGPYDARCVCVTDCPSVEQNVCASNGRSFTNVCLFQLEVCQTKANYTYYHHGSCRGFPVTRGRRHVSEVPRWSDAHCQTVQFEPLAFYPDKRVHVQISVSHVNDTTQVHEAAVSWVEDVSVNNFTLCVMESGRNEGPPHGFATVEYIAYQGAPSGGLAGFVSIPEWWTGTKCQNVDISPERHLSREIFYTLSKHHRRSLKHDAASLWLEDVTSSSFKVCLRELQNFDGPHQDIYVKWLAFETLEQPLFTEHGSSNFGRTSQNPLFRTNYAQCQDVSLVANYTKPPTVLVSPKHSTSGGNVDPKHNAISAWVETVTTSSFKLCFKELYSSNGYDAVTVSHVVLKEICEPGWVYYKGFCYKKQLTCETWTNASTICLDCGSNLVGIESAEEDVFVQHLHHGRPSWIGLNDQANEGVYLWTDGGPVLYTHWAPGISTPYSETEDCVESSGRDMKYHWQPSSCDDCRDFTCKKDMHARKSYYSVTRTFYRASALTHAYFAACFKEMTIFKKLRAISHYFVRITEFLCSEKKLGVTVLLFQLHKAWAVLNLKIRRLNLSNCYIPEVFENCIESPYIQN
ncbi:CD209 antigen E, partial [Paramuricea clavata]